VGLCKDDLTVWGAGWGGLNDESWGGRGSGDFTLPRASVLGSSIHPI